MIAIQRAKKPEILQIKGRQKQNDLCQSYENGQREFEFDNAIYAHATVKSVLKTMQHNKCCFCESKLSHISYGDVEHFRPKAGYQQSKEEALEKPGYYWLVYDWNNLLLSCQICNQRYKKNLFPLKNPQSRAKNHNENINVETALLINPCLQNPEDYISFDHRAEPYSINNNAMGNATIEIVGLNRSDLTEKRLEILNILFKLLKIMSEAKQFPTNPELQAVIKDILPIIQEMSAPQAEYSAMIKAALSKTLQ